MTLTGPIASSTLLTTAGVLGALLVVAYILKLRRRRYEVPFSKLWQKVLREKESSSLWRKLKRLLSLLVQVAFLLLLLFAAADPKLGEASPAARSVVVIIDASASMKALDDGAGKPPRLALAQQAARDLLGRLGGADSAMIVRMDGQTTALSRFESDVPRLTKVVNDLQASDTPADLPRALQAAADALRGRQHPLIVLIGDGAYPEDARSDVTWDKPANVAPTANATAAPSAPVASALGKVNLAGIDVAFIPVGKEARNVGIVAFNVRRYFQNKMSYEVLVEIQNFGTTPEDVRFTLSSGADTVDVKTMTIAPGEKLRKIYPDLGGGDDRQLTGRIEPAPGKDGKAKPADAFPLDDVAYALLPERRKQKVLLVSQDNLYLEGALLLDPNLTVDKLRPEEYPRELAAGTVHTHDVVVFDGYTPALPPPTPAAMYFHPEGEHSPVPLRPGAPVTRPFITDVAPDHPITRWVTLADVNIDKSNVFAPRPEDTVLARSIRDPLIVAGKQEGKKFVAYAFGLDGTDLMLRVAFPVLIMNSLDWFAGDDAELITTYRTGRDWHVPVDSDDGHDTVQVREPGKKPVTAPVIDGRAEFYGRSVGVYQVTTADASFAVAANLADPQESAIKPSPELILGGKKLAGAPEFKASVTRSIWVWLLMAALGLSLVEWMTYNRRITV
jgi:hypothetical protein